MADINSFTFTGRLVKDALMKTLPTGKQLLELSMAVNTGYGEYKKTLFIKVNIWGARGEKIAGFLKKGGLVGVTGSLDKNIWTDRDGIEHTEFVVNAADIVMLSSKRVESESEPSAVEDAIPF